LHHLKGHFQRPFPHLHIEQRFIHTPFKQKPFLKPDIWLVERKQKFFESNKRDTSQLPVFCWARVSVFFFIFGNDNNKPEQPYTQKWLGALNSVD
jgi:hypothetical protein